MFTYFRNTSLLSKNIVDKIHYFKKINEFVSSYRKKTTKLNYIYPTKIKKYIKI